MNYITQTITYETQAEAEKKAAWLKRNFGYDADICKTEDGWEVTWMRHV